MHKQKWNAFINSEPIKSNFTRSREPYENLMKMNNFTTSIHKMITFEIKSAED